MPLHISLLSASLNLEDFDAEVSMDKKRPSLLEDFDLKDLLISSHLLFLRGIFSIDNLFVYQWLLHVDVENCQEALFISNEELLVSTVPEDACVDTLVGILQTEKLCSVGGIKAFKLLIKAYCEDEVCLNDD